MDLWKLVGWILASRGIQCNCHSAFQKFKQNSFSSNDVFEDLNEGEALCELHIRCTQMEKCNSCQL